MSTAHLTSTTSVPRATRGLAWLPLAAIVVMLVVSLLTGRAPVPTSEAATVGVNATAPADIFLDATNCTSGALAIGDLVPGTDPWKTAQDAGSQVCAIDFGTTNNVDGTTLAMLEDPAAPASPTDAMKCVGGSCGTDSLADYEGSTEPAPGTSAFGAQLLSASGIAAPVWPGAPAVQDVQDSASTACTTPTTGTGTCSFTWGATASTTDLPGAYQARAQLVVLAN